MFTEYAFDDLPETGLVSWFFFFDFYIYFIDRLLNYKSETKINI